MSKGRGGGTTPARVVELVNEAVSDKSLRSVSRTTGLGIAAISRYSQGVGEPSLATLRKLADYFKVSVPELRGDKSTPCIWGQYSYDDVDCSIWHPDCGDRLFCFNDGGPVDNEMKFCCYCGKPLIEKPHITEDSEE